MAKIKSLNGFEETMSDSFNLYLKEIGKVPLLSASEERELARRFQDEGDEAARKHLVEANLRLVVSIAKCYLGRGLSLQDLVSEGTNYLMTGIQNFDYRLGNRLSTYVTFWIKRGIANALEDQGRTVRLPSYIVEAINKLRKAESKLEAELGHKPGVSELAEELGMAEDKVLRLLEDSEDVLSLEASCGEDGDGCIADFQEDTSFDPEQLAVNSMIRRKLAELLEVALTEKERAVLILRFGLFGEERHTLEDCSRRFSVPRDRIQKLEAKAIRKLRMPEHRILAEALR